MGYDKGAAVRKYQRAPNDTGSARVQVALLTERIKSLNDHFQTHAKDHHGRRGLRMMVSRRKRLLEYLKRTDLEGYRHLIDQLGLRH
jgi:small subunit ribosomal protein S15